MLCYCVTETEAVMAVTPDKPAPYATPSSIIDIIERYRHRGLPTPVNGDVLGRAGVAQTLIPRTLQSLQTLDLIDAETGTPTATFEALRLAPEAEYKQRLADWLRGTYADVFAFVDPANDGEVRVRDAFRSYQPVGQQDRMVALFMELCRAAGMLPEKSSTAPKPAGRPRTAAPRTAAPSSKPTSGRTFTASFNTPYSARHQAAPGLPAPLAGLLASLPSEGEGWTKETRDRFLATFQAVLDFCFPMVKQPKEINENGGQD
jgi:hypothetical protein